MFHNHREKLTNEKITAEIARIKSNQRKEEIIEDIIKDTIPYIDESIKKAIDRGEYGARVTIKYPRSDFEDIYNAIFRPFITNGFEVSCWDGKGTRERTYDICW